jgi:tryptophan synthase beta subunit
VAHAIRIAPSLGPEQVVLVNLSGRGDKDVMSVQKKLARAVDGDEKAGTR